MNSFTLYLGVGVLNTLVGFGVIFGLMLAGLSPELSNASGYAVGVVFSYAMNKFFTFKARGKGKAEFLRFGAAMLFAYALNFVALKILLRLGLNPYACQIISGAIYTIAGFLLSKLWVFKGARS